MLEKGAAGNISTAISVPRQNVQICVDFFSQHNNMQNLKQGRFRPVNRWIGYNVMQFYVDWFGTIFTWTNWMYIIYFSYDLFGLYYQFLADRVVNLTYVLQGGFSGMNVDVPVPMKEPWSILLNFSYTKCRTKREPCCSIYLGWYV